MQLWNVNLLIIGTVNSLLNSRSAILLSLLPTLQATLKPSAALECICFNLLIIETVNSVLNSSGPTQVDVGVILGSTFAAMGVLILCIAIAIIVVVYLRRKQHAKKVDLRRYVFHTQTPIIHIVKIEVH